MPKFFVTSDIHSAYTPLKKELDAKGFDPNNEDHWLVVCGDVFDRMGESEEVLYFLMSLQRKILVKGNHDILLEELCMREFPYSHDVSNGTVRTVQDIGDMGMGYAFDECCQRTWNKTAAYRGLLRNYFETKRYIFVHSWIATNKVKSRRLVDKWTSPTKDEWMENWRDANDTEWENAMWGNPFWKAYDGLNQTGKTIVFGHWHCSTGHAIRSEGKLSEFGEDACWDPYRDAQNSIIGIDRCVAYTGELNVIVIEDDFLE